MPKKKHKPEEIVAKLRPQSFATCTPWMPRHPCRQFRSRWSGARNGNFRRGD
jgi:hypothetical protein